MGGSTHTFGFASLGWLVVHAIWQGTLVWVSWQAIGRLIREPVRRTRLTNLLVGVFILAQGVTLALLITPLPAFDADHSTITAIDAQSLARVAARLDAAGRIWPVALPEALTQRTEPGPVAWTLPIVAAVSLVFAFALGLRQIIGLLMISRAIRSGVDGTAAFAPVIQRSVPPSVATRVRVVRTGTIKSPVVFGWRRPTLMLPVDDAGLTPAQMDAVVLHELGHVRRADFAWHVIRECVRSLYRWHPAIVGLCTAADDAAEFAADEFAAHSLGDPVEYGSALVALAEHATRPRLSLGADGGSLSNRVRRLLDSQAFGAADSIRNYRFAVGALAACVMACVAAGSAIYCTSRAQHDVSWLVDHDLGRSTLSIIASDSANSAANAMLRDMIAEAKSAQDIDPILLDRFAASVRTGGLDCATLESLAERSPRPTLNRVELADYGTQADRQRVIDALMRRSDSAADQRAQRDAARAAVAVACIDEPVDTGVGIQVCIRSTAMLERMRLTPSQTFALQLAFALHEQRLHAAWPTFTRVMSHDSTVSPDAIHQLEIEARVLPAIRVAMLKR